MTPEAEQIAVEWIAAYKRENPKKKYFAGNVINWLAEKEAKKREMDELLDNPPFSPNIESSRVKTLFDRTIYNHHGAGDNCC